MKYIVHAAARCIGVARVAHGRRRQFPHTGPLLMSEQAFWPMLTSVRGKRRMYNARRKEVRRKLVLRAVSATAPGATVMMFNDAATSTTGAMKTGTHFTPVMTGRLAFRVSRPLTVHKSGF